MIQKRINKLRARDQHNIPDRKKGHRCEKLINYNKSLMNGGEICEEWPENNRKETKLRSFLQ